jgi:hypothetical protein
MRTGESEMESRLAYTAGSMIVRTAEGTRRRVPAGACRIDRHSPMQTVCTIHWSERGADYSAQLSSKELRAYVLGCIVQYA